MTGQGGRVPAIVMAGGSVSPEFAAASGVNKRCLLKHGERTLLETVVEALRGSSVVAPIFVVGDVSVPDGVEGIAEGDGFVANLFRGLDRCRDWAQVIVATSDMPFITPETVSRFAGEALAMNADLVYPIVPVDVCKRAYPTMHRTSLPLREGRFTGGNMVLLRPKAFLDQRQYIDSAYALRKKPLRLAMMLGPAITAAVAASVLTNSGLVRLATLEEAGSRLLHAQARALIMDDPAIATDIDRPEDIGAAGA